MVQFSDYMLRTLVLSIVRFIKQGKNKKETLDSIKIKIRDSNNVIADKSILRLIELMI